MSAIARPAAAIPAAAVSSVTLLLLLSLLPLGARSQAALSVLLVAVALTGLVAVGGCVLRYGFGQTPAALLGGTDTLALTGLPLVVAAQLAWQLGPGLSRGPAHEMLQSLLLLSMLAVFYLLVRAAVTDHHALRRLCVCLAVIGALEAGYGVLNLLAGNERLLTFQRWAYHDSATGTLVSRNHFAFLMELLLPVGAACVAMFAAQSETASDPRDQAVLESEARARRWMIGALVVAMSLALIFSRSRMGIAGFTAATAMVWAANALLRPRGRVRTDARKRRAAPLLALAAVAGLAAVIGLEPVIERFLHIPQDLEHGRLPIWKATAAMIIDAPLFGHGWGTFEALLPAYRPEPTGFFYDHAHNEYLEVAAETGIVGVGLLAWMLFLFARAAVRTLAKPMRAPQRRAVFWFTVAIVSVLLHSAADFGLRTPGVAFTFVAVAAIYSRIAEQPALLIESKDTR